MPATQRSQGELAHGSYQDARADIKQDLPVEQLSRRLFALWVAIEIVTGTVNNFQLVYMVGNDAYGLDAQADLHQFFGAAP